MTWPDQLPRLRPAPAPRDHCQLAAAARLSTSDGSQSGGSACSASSRSPTGEGSRPGISRLHQLPPLGTALGDELAGAEWFVATIRILAWSQVHPIHVVCRCSRHVRCRRVDRTRWRGPHAALLTHSGSSGRSDDRGDSNTSDNDTVKIQAISEPVNLLVCIPATYRVQVPSRYSVH
jgi:hypothetical protein